MATSPAIDHRLRHWIARHRRVFVLTGAGCSTASGIPDYRDDQGEWKRRPPVMIQAFRTQESVYRRYWARAYAGWARFTGASPWAMNTQVNPLLKDALYVAIFISQVLCGLATVTSVSRMIFAFSRDGGLPCSKALASVSPTFRSPVAAIWTGATLAVLFVWGSSVISIGETPVYTIVVSCTVIFLFFSFVIPIVLGLFAYGTSKWPTMGPWNMGRFWYTVFALLSVLSMVIIFVIGIQPPNDWALYITIGFLVLTAIVWFGFEARRFQGPPVGDVIAKRQAEIAAAEAALDKRS